MCRTRLKSVFHKEQLECLFEKVLSDSMLFTLLPGQKEDKCVGVFCGGPKDGAWILLELKDKRTYIRFPVLSDILFEISSEDEIPKIRKMEFDEYNRHYKVGYKVYFIYNGRH